MALRYPVAYNPKTRLEDDVAFSSENLVVSNYVAKAPSLDGNKIKNGDIMTESLEKLESRIAALQNVSESVSENINVDKVKLDDYSAKIPGQDGNELSTGDSLKDVASKLEARIVDLVNKFSNFVVKYTPTEQLNEDIDTKIDDAVKDLASNTYVDNKIINSIINFITKDEVDSKIESKISEVASAIPDTNEIENKVNRRIDELVNMAPESLDTLKEIANAINNDPNFYDAIISKINTKLDADATAVNALLINGFSVACDVPYDAVFTDTTYHEATEQNEGLMSTYDKIKLDGIENNANYYILPAATSSKLGGVMTGTGLDNNSGLISLSASGATAGTYGPNNDVTGSNGTTVTIPKVTVDKYGRVTGIESKIYTSVNTTYSAATQSAAGLMSAADKKKLDDVTITAVTDGKRYISLLDSTTSFGFHTNTNFYINCAENKLYVPNISSSGDITGARVYNAVYNDYAELMPRGEETEPGDIVMLDLKAKDEQYIKATDKLDTIVAGVHSNEFGMLIGGEKPVDNRNLLEYNIDKFIPVALSGRVHVKFIGKAKKGAEVVPSSEPGYGRLYNEGVDNPKKIIGYLVEDDDRTDKRKLKIRITR